MSSYFDADFDEKLGLFCVFHPECWGLICFNKNQWKI